MKIWSFELFVVSTAHNQISKRQFYSAQQVRSMNEFDVNALSNDWMKWKRTKKKNYIREKKIKERNNKSEIWVDFGGIISCPFWQFTRVPISSIVYYSCLPFQQYNHSVRLLNECVDMRWTKEIDCASGRTVLMQFLIKYGGISK